MKIKASTVAAYMAALPPERGPGLNRLRTLCQVSLKGFGEVMQFGMPCYQWAGRTVVAFASQPQHISLYIARPGVVDEYRSRLGKLRVGQGCIRFKKPEQMDFELLGEVLRSVHTSVHGPLA